MARKKAASNNPLVMLAPEAPAPPAAVADPSAAPAGYSQAIGRRVEALPVARLWVEHQPREIVPEEELQRLIAADRAQPHTVLEVLQAAAQHDSYYGGILDGITGLASSIGERGVLQPLEYVVDGRGRAILRDGHRRSLAAVLAGLEVVPAIEVTEPSDLDAIANPFIVNLQRQDLTAIEKGAALLRLALLVARRLADQAGHTEAGPIDLRVLIRPAGGEGAGADGEAARENGSRSTITGASRAVAVHVRDTVCAMVGLPLQAYYRLLALNRLTPEARALGRALTESHLRPITALPQESQAEVTAFAVRRRLTSKEIGTLAQVARAGDRDAVQRVMARLAKEERAPQRTAVSWEPLLHAVPRDLDRRCQALEAELAALDPDKRQVRLNAMKEQMPLLLALHSRFETMVATYGVPPGVSETEGGAPEPG